MPTPETIETVALWLAVTGYFAALLRALGWPRRAQPPTVILAAAVLVHTWALALRWSRIGHGPFTTMHEVLSSNAWSLALVLVLAAWRLPAVRASTPFALAVIAMLGAWALASSDAAGHFPPTYHTWLLYAHAVLGKAFLGLTLVAVTLGSVVLARAGTSGRAPTPTPARLATLPSSIALDALGARFLGAAFVFHTLMLIAGAAWAQDAWGRYWDWDPLETWTFLTWVALALALHLRAGGRCSPAVHAGMTVAAFVIAFLTFFGVPFVSTAPHQGAI